jgi:hypothetical protein
MALKELKGADLNCSFLRPFMESQSELVADKGASAPLLFIHLQGFLLHCKQEWICGLRATGHEFEY